MRILVTGGAGYIGAHACARLLAGGHDVVALDSLELGAIEAIELLRGLPSGDRLAFVRADVGDRSAVDTVLADAPVDAVMHFAGLASVPESIVEPLRYARANLAAGIELLAACAAAGVPRFLFSSSCATYGQPETELLPIDESCPQLPLSPYGWSKLAFERVLLDHARASGRRFGVGILRYFNVVGCDRGGLLGEPHDPPRRIVPIILRNLLGQLEHVTVAGADFPTPDGTCIRDYLHVEDVVDAHALVLEALAPGDERIYNLGIGRGASVREVVAAAERVTGRRAKLVVGPRRPGDAERLVADPGRIQRDLGWRARITDLDEMIASAWRWFAAHPHGYAGAARGASRST